MAFRQTLDTEIEYLKGIGPQRAEALKKELQIFTWGDLLNYFPFRYVDRTRIYKIREINSDAAFIQLKGKLGHFREEGTKQAKRLIALLEDDSGTIELVWFKGLKWIAKTLRPGTEYIVFGKPSVFKSRFNIVHPEMEAVSATATALDRAKFYPVYSTTEKLTAKGLDSKGIMKLQWELNSRLNDLVQEFMPVSLLNTLKLLPLIEAYRQIHFPENTEILERARNRLKFDELFLHQLELLRFKRKRDESTNGFVFQIVGNYFNRFYNEVLPFQLTEAQKRVVKEIRTDTKSGRQMNRLLQGDVGSGKTIVALLAMLIAIDNGFQCCLMAPTEILAMQHFKTITGLVEQLGLNVSLLTGSTKIAERRKLEEGLKNTEVNILIGTHALIEDNVIYKKLGLVIIDEQHRFGVAQRAKLWKKNDITPPHVLVMTATPIPRTLAMTLYGDLEVSVLDEMPPGRKPVKTMHFFENSRLRVLAEIKKAVKQGRQVYIVYPLIEESEKMDYMNLMDGYDVICREFPRPEYQVGIMHGRLKAEEKDYEMNLFKKGITHILVSTTVIEVGVDVPNASLMIIESAERFGLSQLHQLRGRVGRGADESVCILMTGNKLTQDARTRMETMVQTTDGFKIAEVDLNLRGPGDLAGTQQSGMIDFRIANLATDQAILKVARASAMKILDDDPAMQQAGYMALRRQLEIYRKDHFNWLEIS